MAFTMYDSINVDQIPVDAQAVAGYVGGKWPTYADGSLAKRCPKARKLSIAVASRYDAECLDVEPGDATNNVAAGWVKRQQKRGVKHPVVYTSVANVRRTVERARAVRDQAPRHPPLDRALHGQAASLRSPVRLRDVGDCGRDSVHEQRSRPHARRLAVPRWVPASGLPHLSAEQKKKARWRHRLPGAKRESAKADKLAAPGAIASSA
jgi:hypothetical protein